MNLVIRFVTQWKENCGLVQSLLQLHYTTQMLKPFSDLVVALNVSMVSNCVPFLLDALQL